MLTFAHQHYTEGIVLVIICPFYYFYFYNLFSISVYLFVYFCSYVIINLLVSVFFSTWIMRILSGKFEHLYKHFVPIHLTAAVIVCSASTSGSTCCTSKETLTNQHSKNQQHLFFGCTSQKVTQVVSCSYGESAKMIKSHRSKYIHVEPLCYILMKEMTVLLSQWVFILIKNNNWSALTPLKRAPEMWT